MIFNIMYIESSGEMLMIMYVFEMITNYVYISKYICQYDTFFHIWFIGEFHNVRSLFLMC